MIEVEVLLTVKANNIDINCMEMKNFQAYSVHSQQLSLLSHSANQSMQSARETMTFV